MSRGPGRIDLSHQDYIFPNDSEPSRPQFQLDLPSPRVGEIPPALSPLDAFAQQSRLLAKRFEAQHNGRRISRLDADEVANEFGRKPSYFTSSAVNTPLRERQGDEDDRIMPLPSTQIHQQPHSSHRPISHYPMFGSATEPTDAKPETPASDGYYDASDLTPGRPDGYFSFPIPRSNSPEPFDARYARNGDASPAVPSLSGSIDSLRSSIPRSNTVVWRLAGRLRRSLAPPASPPKPAQKKSMVSIRSIMDGRDDEPLKPPRKLSDSSHGPRARSPFTPDPHVTSRSPSIRSEHSAVQDEFRRPSFNFSRPLSSSSKKDLTTHRPTLSQSNGSEIKHSFEIFREPSPLRKTSESSYDSRSPIRQVHTPTYETDVASEDELGNDGLHAQGGAPSYVYSKYSLPRGRTVEQLSMAATGDWNQHQFRWDARTESGFENVSTPPTSDRKARPFKQALDLSRVRSQSADGRGTPSPRGILHRSTPSTPSVASHSTDRTIRAHTRNSPSQDIVNMSAEQHLEKGIECHSSGSLSKSTYHLRHAARAGNPTGMLLYALACRHGWGMRANQAEGVQWLKKAVDSSNLKFLDTPHDVPLPGQQSKSRKAEFALAVYELGMSYMNGWGTSKDKTLALRCFEVAGDWGDCDALAEAGFCYAQGVGCKKDMKKAAGLYRKAEAGGMSMAGNSWIYKPKYMDDPAAGKTGDGAKSGRSRARSLFGRKKSVPVS